MFFLILAFLLICSYFFLVYFLQLFFNGKIGETKFSVVHIVLFLFTYAFFIVIANSIPDVELGNRLQHALGGGYTMVLVFFFAFRASQVTLTRFQFVCLALLVATAFGVANELAESVDQIIFGRRFAGTIEDTWYDLWSNSIGALLGVVVCTWFIEKKK